MILTIVSRKTTYKVLSENVEYQHFGSDYVAFRTQFVLLCSVAESDS